MTVSTFALYDIAKQVGGNNVDVRMVIPFGVEVHSFEPTPKTIISIQKSALFFYSGAELEPWIIKLAQGKNMRDMSRYVDLREMKEACEEHEEEHHHHDRERDDAVAPPSVLPGDVLRVDPDEVPDPEQDRGGDHRADAHFHTVQPPQPGGPRV